MFVLSQCTIDVTDLDYWIGLFFCQRTLLTFLAICIFWSDAEAFVLKKYDITVCLTYYRLHFGFFSVSQLEAKLVEMDKSNTQLKLTVTNLNLRVKTGNKEMQREMQKVSTCHTKKN